MKILLFDLETFPNLAYVWGKYQQDVIKFKQQTCIATFAAKWLDEKQVISAALSSWLNYRPGSYDDRQVVKLLWELFDKADVVVAHNGRDFDVKVAQARFLVHGFPPPSPFKIIDTKEVTRRISRFNSNKLDDLGEILGLGKKIKTDFSLWQGCIDGDKKAWAKMLAYNRQDVLLLEKLYKLLLPYIPSHPNLAEGLACPRCGSKKLQSRGMARTTTREYRRLQCMGCGGWSRLIKGSKTAEITQI